MKITHVFILLTLCAGTPVPAAVPPTEAGASPAINLPFLNPDFDTWVTRFEREGREVYDRRHAIVDAVGLRPGMVVADVGAGTGLFTRMFAPRVAPGGQVIAVDISRGFIDNILRTAREQGLSNVIGVVNDQSSVRLPPASVDLVFICDTYHHFEQPRATMASIRRALRTGGEVVVIDFRREPQRSSRWVLDHVRAGKDEVVREIEAAGFALVDELDFMAENYFLRFRRRDE